MVNYPVIIGDPEQEIAKCEVFLILHYPRTAQLLLRTDSHRFQLPCLLSQPQIRLFYYQKTFKFLPQVQQHFDFTFPITLLRCMWNHFEDGIFRPILVLECHGQTVEPPTGMDWMDYSCVVFPQAAIHHASNIIEQFTSECRTGVEPSLRPLFARRGWYESTVQWMKSQLSSKGFHPVVEVTQLQCSYRGTVLKAETSDGTAVYLKCSPQFTNEAAVCKVLVDLIPKFVEAPIATDIKRRLLLMRDQGEFKSPLRFDFVEQDEWSNELAEIHQSTIGKEEVLLRAGLRMLTMDMMESKLDNVISYAEQTHVVNSHVTNHLRTVSEQLRRQCREVNKLGIPVAFVHGDLYFSNVYRSSRETGVGHGISDFGESTVSHPFMDTLGCAYKPVYCENWMRFLERHFPEVAHGTTTEKLLDSLFECTKIFSLWEAVRLHEEMETVESPTPPEIRSDLKGELMCLFRTCNGLQSKESDNAPHE